MKYLAAALSFSLFLLPGCTAMTQTNAPAQPQSEFKNLQILPRTITRPELLSIMRSFTRGLGVRCNECHVVTATEPKEVLDFPSDAKEEKRVARVMMQMTSQINGPWLERVEAAEGHEEEHHPAAPEGAEAASHVQPRVTCWTCHRGKVEPELPPPPPPETGAGS